MTLRELRYLIALADRAHFGRAAEDCHISQPTLSTQIRKLEEYLGVSLIERNTKSVSLTPMGEEVVRSARQIVSQADALLAATRVPRGPLEGRLSIGIIPTLGPYFLPSFIPLTKSRYPRLQLAVHEDLTQHLLERLRNYQIDAALLALPLENQDLECLPLFDEPFWFACSPEHPLAQAEWVAEADLRYETLLLLADGHCLRGQALAACGRQPTQRGHDARQFVQVPGTAPAEASHEPAIGQLVDKAARLAWTKRGYPATGPPQELGKDAANPGDDDRPDV